MSSKNRGKYGDKIARNSCLGVFFPERGKSRLGSILKTSGVTCAQHWSIFQSAGPILGHTELEGTLDTCNCITHRFQDIFKFNTCVFISKYYQFILLQNTSLATNQSSRGFNKAVLEPRISTDVMIARTNSP